MTQRDTVRRLDSWKEIAEYLGRDLRTVMRWEQERGLPVRRVPGGKRSAVFAYPHDVDQWLERGEGLSEAAEIPAAGNRVNRVAPAGFAGLAGSRGRVLRITIAVAVLLTAFFAALRFLPSQRKWPSRVSAQEASFEGSGTSLRFSRNDLDLGVRTYRIRAGDFNEDGKTDLVFTSSPNDQLGILLAKGGGLYSPPRLHEGCAASDDVAVADFNHDGHADLAVSCVAGNKVVLFWGKGDGSFSGRTEIDVPGGPRVLTVADLSGSGWPDLVVATARGDLYLLKNTGGKFSSSLLARCDAVTFPVFTDWDGDGIPDLLTGLTIQGKSGVGFFPGKSDGTFGPLQFLVELRSLPGTLAVADFDGDGRKDMAVSSWEDIRVFLGQPGKLSPTLSQEFLGRTKSWFMYAADFDGDGQLDLLGSNTAQGKLFFFRGLGNGKFAEPATMNLESYAQPTLIVDLDGGGKPEILVPSYARNALIVLKPR